MLVDMAYEIGGAGLAGFTKFLAAVRSAYWVTAAAELKNSLLFLQVPARESENVQILLTGEFPPGIKSAADLVKRHEGCKLQAAPDAKGKWAVGWGHDIQAPEPGEPAPVCTQEAADAMLADDLALAEARAEADLGTDFWNQEAAA